MVGESIGIGRRFAGASHADHVRSEATPEAADIRDDIPPEIRMSRIPVQKYDRVAMTGVDVADVSIAHADSATRMRIDGTRDISHGIAPCLKEQERWSMRRGLRAAGRRRGARLSLTSAYAPAAAGNRV